MIVYLATPSTQLQAHAVSNMPVLLAFVENKNPWVNRYQQTFSRILIDSGAFSEFNSGVEVDIGEYREWSEQWIGHADAIAGLDDIRGDYRRGIKNLREIPWTFPTWHDTDPLEIIPELVAISRERGKWLGIGLKPPRENKERIIRQALELVPDDIHVHGWALRAYTHIRRLDSVDSTNWWRDAMKYRRDLPFLTLAECLEIVVKRYAREARCFEKTDPADRQMVLGAPHRLEPNSVLGTDWTDTEGQRNEVV